jgi:hypothetical protein
MIRRTVSPSPSASLPDRFFCLFPTFLHLRGTFYLLVALFAFSQHFYFFRVLFAFLLFQDLLLRAVTGRYFVFLKYSFAPNAQNWCLHSWLNSIFRERLRNGHFNLPGSHQRIVGLPMDHFFYLFPLKKQKSWWLWVTATFALETRWITSPEDIYKRPFIPWIYHHHRQPQPTYTSPISSKMRNFPQELVDRVIDELADSVSKQLDGPLSTPDEISKYSTVSRRWVGRTQKHHFKSLCFRRQGKLYKWRTAVTPTSDVLQHVQELTLEYIYTLEGFGDHFCGFTKVKKARFEHCGLFHSLDDIRPLTSLGESLVDLEIEKSDYSSEVIAQFLASLPLLRRFRAFSLLAPSPDNFEVSLPRIPFFEGANALMLSSSRGCPPVTLQWIPSTARFSELGLGISCLTGSPGTLNEWITSSSKSLKCLDLIADWHRDLNGAYLTQNHFLYFLLTASPSRLHFRLSGSLRMHIPRNPGTSSLLHQSWNDR